MKIDSYPHILAEPLREKLGDLPLSSLRNQVLLDVDERLRLMDSFPDYVQILVPFPVQPLVPFLGGQEAAADPIRAANDHLAGLVQKNPERFIAFAGSLPLADVDQAIEELGRCLDDLGAVGVQLETNIGGVPIVDPRFEPLFAELARRGCPAWLHPVRGKGIGDFPSEDVGKYGLWQALGWPYETSIVLSRLVLDGYLDRYPGLKIIVHHGGGMLAHFSGRLGAVLEHLGRIGFDPDLAAAVEGLSKPLDDYFRMFYADTVLFGAGHAVQCVVDYFGVDHVLFGSDMPFDPEQGPGFIRDTIRNVEDLPLGEGEAAKIFEHNARRVLGL